MRGVGKDCEWLINLRLREKRGVWVYKDCEWLINNCEWLINHCEWLINNCEPVWPSGKALGW